MPEPPTAGAEPQPKSCSAHATPTRTLHAATTGTFSSTFSGSDARTGSIGALAEPRRSPSRR